MEKENKKHKLLIKSYKLQHKANPHKLNALFELYTAYSKEYKKLIFNQWALFINNQIPSYQNKFNFSHIGSTKHIKTELSARFTQALFAQVCVSLNSYLSQIELKFNEIINKSTIKDKDLLHQLRTINSQHSWLHNNKDFNNINNNIYYYPNKIIADNYGNLVTSHLKEQTPISEETLRLSRKIFKQIIKRRVKFPDTQKPKLILDNRFYEMEESNSQSFDYWLKINTLIPRKKVLVPIKSNTFFEHANGQLGTTIELDFKHFDYEIKQHKYNSLSNKKLNNKKDNSKNTVKNNKVHKFQKVKKTLSFIFNKQTKIQPEFIDKESLTHTISFDLGLCNFLATSNGELYGKYWLEKLKKYDEKITTLLADRQYIFRKNKDKKNKIRSKKYDSLIAQVRGFIKTEINRILNHYFEINKNINTVIIESLNFDKPELSKKLNRIIKNFGLKFFINKLKELSLIKGFKIEELNPAYSSQECSDCGYVDKNNRKTQSKFKCLCCGKEINADINGSRTLLKRFESKQSTTNNMNKSNIYKARYKGIILEQIKVNFINGMKFLLSNGKVSRRKLKNIMIKNQYFKEFVKTTEAAMVKPMTADNNLNLKFN